MRTIKYLTLAVLALVATNANALSPDPKGTSGSNLLFIAMGILAGVLLLVITILSGVLRTAVKTKIREAIQSKTSKTAVLIFFLLSTLDTFAQAEPKNDLYNALPIGGMHPMGFYSLFIVILLELFVILWLCLMILRMIMKKESAAVKSAGEAVKSESFLANFISRKIFGVKPVTSDKDVMLDHDYDGIRELDNDLPPWWKYGFYLTIVTGIIYMISYHVTHTSKSSVEEYEAEMAQAEIDVKAYKVKMAMDIDESNAVFLEDKDKIAKGKEIYTKNCAVCHGAEGQGLVGPNFADNSWLYGNKPGEIFKTIKNGTNKGMKAWKDELSPVDIQNVVSFIHTLQGTNPPNPKAAEGTVYEDSNIASPSVSSDSSANVEIKS